MYRQSFVRWECFDVFNTIQAGQVLRVFGAEKDEKGQYREPALGQTVPHSRISTVVLRYKFFDTMAWYTGHIEPLSDMHKVFPDANILSECKATRISAVREHYYIRFTSTELDHCVDFESTRQIERPAQWRTAPSPTPSADSTGDVGHCPRV